VAVTANGPVVSNYTANASRNNFSVRRHAIATHVATIPLIKKSTSRLSLMHWPEMYMVLLMMTGRIYRKRRDLVWEWSQRLSRKAASAKRPSVSKNTASVIKVESNAQSSAGVRDASIIRECPLDRTSHSPHNTTTPKSKMRDMIYYYLVYLPFLPSLV
jgi:hypothetical protein